MIIGTTNKGKVQEIASICTPLGIELQSRALDVPETEDTFRGNALLKAAAYSKAFPGQYVLVEDSGLVVPTLGGLPGPWSARFADLDIETKQVRGSGENDDAKNNERLLELMRDIPFEQRGAHFEIEMLVAIDGQVAFSATGKAFGWITNMPRGSHGFGYDPVFVGSNTYERTYAEIDSARKNLRSHRAEALKSLRTWLAGVVMSGVTL